MVDCEHQWDSDREERLCVLCGEVRTFPTGEELPRVIWPGRGAELDPVQLPWADKALIAKTAKGHDFKKVKKLTGISIFLLRGWVGASSRGKKAGPAAKEEAPAAPTPTTTEGRLKKPWKRKQIGRYYEQNKEMIIGDYQSMTLLKFFKKWGITSATWTKLRNLWRVPKKGRGGKARVPAAAPREKGKEPVAPIPATVEGMADLVMEVLYLRGYQQAVRDIFDCRPGHEYGRQADGHRKHLVGSVSITAFAKGNRKTGQKQA